MLPAGVDGSWFLRVSISRMATSRHKNLTVFRYDSFNALADCSLESYAASRILLLVTECRYRIDFGGSPGREVAGGDGEKCDGDDRDDGGLSVGAACSV